MQNLPEIGHVRAWVVIGGRQKGHICSVSERQKKGSLLK